MEIFRIIIIFVIGSLSFIGTIGLILKASTISSNTSSYMEEDIIFGHKFIFKFICIVCIFISIVFFMFFGINQIKEIPKYEQITEPVYRKL